MGQLRLPSSRSLETPDCQSVPDAAMFHDTWNMAISETQLIASLEDQLRRRLPSTWIVEVDRKPKIAPVRPDAIVRLRGPDDREATLVVEAKSHLEPRAVSNAIEQLRRWPDSRPLVVAPFLSARTREELTLSGANYADSTGNLRLVLDEPAIFIEIAGATSNPYPEERSVPLRTLRGPSAARVVRAVCDFRPPYGIRELATRAGASPASVSRVVDLLDRDALLTRGKRGDVSALDWPGAIRRWVQDYSLTDSNRTETFLEPRGLDALPRKLEKLRDPYAVTGSLPASAVAPVAAPRLATVYVEDMAQAAKALGLREADTGANVLLVEPFDPVVFDRRWIQNDVAYCALSQVAADLLTSPGRGPAEATELLHWMEANEDAWRS